MLVFEFLRWWYGPGWKGRVSSIGVGAKSILSAFSVPILLRTMFNPWKQITTKSFADTALEDKIKASIDNLVSRTIGFIVRIMTLLIACIAVIINVIFKLITLIMWPAIPFLPAIFLLLALVELAS